jgi:hypothetical protein
MKGGLTRKQAFMILNCLPSIGPVTLQRLMEAFDDGPGAKKTDSKTGRWAF